MSQWYLIHGAASTRLIWSRQMQALPSATRASLPPLPEVEPSNLIEAWSDWCLNDLKEPSIIMGHSMGGAIAQLMALKAPELVRGLVLVGTGPRLPVNPALIKGLQDNPRQTLEKITRWSLSRNPDTTLLERSLEQTGTIDIDRAVREFVACLSFDVRSQLHRVRCFKALIAGEQDRMTPVGLMEEFRNIWPQAPFYLVENAGHMMMLEQAERFNAILTQILNQMDAIESSSVN